MSQLPAMPVWWADFFNKTDHLSNEEQWAYLKLMAKTWVRNVEPIPDRAPDIARALGMTVKRWLKIRPRIAPFFDLSGGTWRQQNLEKTFAVVAERVENSRRNGKQGGRPLSNKNNDIAKPTGSQQGSLDETQSEPIQSQSQKQREEVENPPAEVVDLASRARRASSYAFEGKVVRLNHDDFEKWRMTFTAIPDLMAELYTIDVWLSERGFTENWFHRTSAMLSRKHQEWLDKKAEAKAWAERPIDERYPNEGVFRKAK